LAIVAASALGAAFTGACKSDDDERTPVEVYASQYGDATCAVWEGCCRANGLSFDRGKCGLFAAIYIQGDIDRHLAAGATFDPAAADNCIAEAVEATKACVKNEDRLKAREACARVWSGPRMTGDKCKSDMECASSTAGAGVCVGGTANVEGTCSIRTPNGQLDDVCGKTVDATEVPETVADCGPELQCNLLSQTCSPRVPLGGSTCSEFNSCEEGLFCDDTGVCVAGLDAGADCDVNVPERCTSGACILGKCGANAIGTLTPCTGEMM
jgi:hypothetical protein